MVFIDPEDLHWQPGCQMVYFRPNLGKFLRASDCKMLIYILCTFGIFYGHLGNFVTIWYIFPILVPRTKKNLATLIGS
jgi:hypothetical protein